VTSRDMVPHSVHIVHIWMIEIKSKAEGMMLGHMYTAY